MEQRELMEERIDEMLDEEIFSSPSEEQEQEKKKFVIDSDIKAEWALDKIRKTHAYYDRLKRTCSDIIAKYSAILEKYARQESAECAGLEYMLMQYFDTVEHKVTKTQESYKLPTGKLIRKHHAPQIVRDDERLVAWMKANDWDGYVRTKETPDWGAFKVSRCTVTEDGTVYDENGVRVEGLTVNPVPDTFEVVTKE
jgi:phage host-nuclease inhibitor protein Gam